MSKREGGSVMLAFAGFAVLVLTVRGTWGRAFGALVGHKTGAAAAGNSAAPASSTTGQFAYPLHAGTLAYAGVTNGRPGQGPRPASPPRTQGGGGSSYGGFETPFIPSGWTAAQLAAAAARYAQGRSYNGSPYSPGMVMQEGHVEYRNGVPGIYIKYRTAGGDSTEWTPI